MGWWRKMLKEVPLHSLFFHILQVQEIVDDYKNANLTISKNCKKISEMLLVKIDGKKHYENLEFEEEQVIQSLCFVIFMLIFPLSHSSYYLNNQTISVLMTCPVDKIQRFSLVSCLRYLPSSCSKAGYCYISTEIMQVVSLIHIHPLFYQLPVI